MSFLLSHFVLSIQLIKKGGTNGKKQRTKLNETRDPHDPPKCN